MVVQRNVFPPLSNNCYLIVDEATNQSALVDCPVWNEKMEEFIGDTDLKYILLTHGHYDHIGGVKEVRARYGAKAAISSKDEPMLTSAVKSLAFVTGNEFNKTQADIIVKQGSELALGDIRIKVIETPGHTKGGVCYLAENSLFTGDTLFCGSCGRTDFPGGSGEEMLASLRRLKELDGNLDVYPGHDSVSTLDYERRFNPYMNM